MKDIATAVCLATVLICVWRMIQLQLQMRELRKWERVHGEMVAKLDTATPEERMEIARKCDEFERWKERVER